MSNERLERIKERVNYHGHLDDDIEFLIEQAEKNITCQEVLDLQKYALKGLLEQNKRYREALEFYAEQDNYEWETSYRPQQEIDCMVIDDGGHTAREALEGEGE